MNATRGGIKTVGIIGLACLLCFAVSNPVSAQDDVQQLKQQLEQMTREMQAVQEKLAEMEKKNEAKKEEVEEMNDRLDKAELHAATDKVAFGIEFRSRGDTLSYSDIQVAPSMLTSGLIGQTLSPADLPGMLAMMPPGVMVPDKYDATNDIILTNKFRLTMKAKVNDQLNFDGRLAAYKVFGDSSGVKFNQGSLNDVTLDGNISSLPHGDTIRLERAYFNYKKDWGRVPTNFSVGRRPGTDGPPLEYMNYSLEGGSPLATIINWQFDGASYNLGLEEVTGIPGAAFKICYGQGFEGDWGNSYALNARQPDVDDVHFGGFIATLFDNDSTSAVLNYAHAWDITDGFTGLSVMPFIVSDNGDGTFTFSQNEGGYITRLEPYTEIGDWDAASLLLRTNLTERFDKDIDLFVAGSWSHTSPSRTSENPFYKFMGQGLLNSNGELEDRDGYMIYLGAVFAMPWDARFGLEYNYGSRYWFNFSGAEDSVVASKLAVRGHVYEGYWHQPIVNDNFFATIGVRYYDYEYTGSGSPMGEPVKIDELSSLDAFNPVVDKVMDGYISLTFRY
ncbi:hypothetical protein DSCW_56660 [Desulfosarcina widdelii]|uniref:DUF3373 domain-containing protein n=1 Tax=Desulfosarcina widdelii TaxID=947919 RepID=A0A5K7ZDI1_9BACT|nr:DUF3373 family protein [Desulfosarcina widdelii]BBO78249.1 hypothetical protein DSCW_56660 [Desulfosarcina widdelii]